MLRLWPERYAISLFPEQSWLRAGKRLHETHVEDSDGHMDGLVAMADQLLSLMPPASYWRPAVDLIVSDESARTLLLPWQERLRTPVQQLRYAEACLADSGVALDGSWLVQAGFRRYGDAGLALAVRRDLAEGLLAVTAARRLRLRTLLPVSAAAYWRYSGEASGLASTLLLSEKNRVTAMRYHGRTLHAVDVQPVAGDRQRAELRLLRRQALATPHSIACWSASDVAITEEALAGCLPGATAKQLPRGCWE